MKYDKQEIGQRIRAERKACKMSQYELSKAVGISRSTLIHIEKGDTLPELTPLTKICEALGCRVSYILGEEEEYQQTKEDIEVLRTSLALQNAFLHTTVDALDTLLEKFESIAQMSDKALEKCGEIRIRL
ncbi:MAG: helix-turn-helix transcriptional regulator [[Eubacterium] sulci]|nr:helix-turn-helix transcriptional regulator [[Eubacterium] sulci]